MKRPPRLAEVLLAPDGRRGMVVGVDTSAKLVRLEIDGVPSPWFEWAAVSVPRISLERLKEIGAMAFEAAVEDAGLSDDIEVTLE